MYKAEEMPSSQRAVLSNAIRLGTIMLMGISICSTGQNFLWIFCYFKAILPCTVTGNFYANFPSIIKDQYTLIEHTPQFCDLA